MTGNEGNLTDLLATELRGRGMSVKVMPVEGNRCNLPATFHPGSARILFNTHLDTVPEQVGPHEDDDWIYGRGACDACGILAAQLDAPERLHKDGISGLHGIAFGSESAIAIDWLVGNDPMFHLETIPGFETAVATSNTDILYFGWHTARMYLLGPGSILDAHTDNEKISKAEQARGVDLYCQLVREAISV